MDPLDDLELPAPPGKKGFLAKLSGWLKPWKRHPSRRGPSELLDPLSPIGSSGGEPAWPRRRTSQISRLEEAFDKLVGLVDTIDRHIANQADRSEQSVTQSRRMADALAQSQALERQRTEAVEELGNQYRTQTRQMQQMAEAVEALPRAIKNQSEQLAQIRDQLEAQLEAQLSTAQGIQQLAGAAEGLRAAAAVQRDHFERLHESQQTANLKLIGAVTQQGRRLSWAIGLAVAAALTAAGAAAAAIWLTLHGL